MARLQCWIPQISDDRQLRMYIAFKYTLTDILKNNIFTKIHPLNIRGFVIKIVHKVNNCFVTNTYYKCVLYDYYYEMRLSCF